MAIQQGTPDPKLVSVNEKGETVDFLINPIPCVQTAIEDTNIRMNKDMIKKWICVCEPNEDKIIIVSAGPSLEMYGPKIKEYQEKGYKVSCVKHSLPRLLKIGIEPDFCVVLDPRCVIGKSTHGIKRLDLYKNAPDKTVFLIASVTDFRTTDYLLSQGKKVIGWHRYTDILQKYPELQPQLGGGSCSALGSLALFYTLGFREMILVGFDSSYEKREDVRLKVFEFGSKYEPNLKYLSTGELGAQAQELEALLVKHRQLIKFDVWSQGLGGNIWKHIQQKVYLPNYNLVLL